MPRGFACLLQSEAQHTHNMSFCEWCRRVHHHDRAAFCVPVAMQ